MAKPCNPLVTCLQLRSKEMFYQTATTRDPEHDAEIDRLYGASDTTSFWCQCTQTARGPDHRIVGREECSRRDRTCFVGLEKLAPDAPSIS